MENDWKDKNSAYLQEIRNARANLSKAMKAYREYFDDEPDFGWGRFPVTSSIPEYIKEIDKAIRTNTPINKSKDFDHLTDSRNRTKI